MANTKGQIFGINGPVVKVKGSDSFEMQEMVYVGNEELIGEVIGVTSDTTIVQVYEETTGRYGRSFVNNSCSGYIV